MLVMNTMGNVVADWVEDELARAISVDYHRMSVVKFIKDLNWFLRIKQLLLELNDKNKIFSRKKVNCNDIKVTRKMLNIKM